MCSKDLWFRLIHTWTQLSSRLNKLIKKTQFHQVKKTLEENNYLAISAYLYFLIVIPRVVQMMCKLERNAFFSDPLHLKYTSKSSRSPVLTFLTPYWWTHSSKTLEEKLEYERTDIMRAYLLMLELNKWVDFIWNFQISFSDWFKHSHTWSWISQNVYT